MTSSSDNPYAGSQTPPQAKRESATSWWLAVVGVLVSLAFLSNLDFGGIFPPFILEIPDWIPGIGNIDEALMTAVLVASLSRLGIDVIPGLHRRRNDVIDHPPRGKNS